LVPIEGQALLLLVGSGGVAQFANKKAPRRVGGRGQLRVDDFAADGVPDQLDQSAEQG
jgi:hypothetical protein